MSYPLLNTKSPSLKRGFLISQESHLSLEEATLSKYIIPYLYIYKVPGWGGHPRDFVGTKQKLELLTVLFYHRS